MRARLSRRAVLHGAGGIGAAAALGAALTPAADAATIAAGQPAEGAAPAAGAPAAVTAGLVYLSVGPTGFLPEILANGRTIATGGAYTNGFLNAPLALPSGALVKELSFCLRNTTGGPAAAHLAKLPNDDGIGSNVATVTGPNSALSTVTSVAVNHVVDGDASYSARVFTPNDGSLRVYSARVGFIPPSAGLRFVTPTRVYDSRAGNPPNNVVKGPLSNGTRVVDGKNNGSGVPATAQAVLATVTVANTSANGFLSLYENGIAFPGVSTINWALPNSIVANTTVTAVDALARCVALVPAGAATDFFVDVLGYFV